MKYRTSPAARPETCACFLSLLLTLLLSLPLAAQSFSTHEYSTGLNPLAVTRADFNHDGILDIATANNSSNSVSVMLGNGNGTFRTRMDFLVGTRPTGIVAVDLNHDGKMDLVTTNADPNLAHTMSVLLGNGDGTFKAHHDFFGGQSPLGLVAADFNGDGKMDIATGWTLPHDNNISVFMGDGAGGFTSEVRTSNLGYVETDPNEGDRRMTQIRVSDFNRDGKPDIAFIECCGGIDVEMGDIFVALGTGGGQFTQKQVAQNSVPRELTVGDINRDGKSDILIAYDGCNTECVGVQLYAGHGDGTFSLQSSGSLDSVSGPQLHPGGIVAADLNGDTLNDIAVAMAQDCCPPSGSNDKVAVLLGKPDGTFAAPSYVSLGTDKIPRWITSADFNRDGRADLATANWWANTTSVLINTTPFAGCPASTVNPSVTICTPANGATATSPVHVVAETTDSSKVTSLAVYVDSVKKYSVAASRLNTYIAMAAGSRRVTVSAHDSTGRNFWKTINITVK